MADPFLTAIAYAMGISMILGAATGWAIFFSLTFSEVVLPRLRELRARRRQAPRIPALEP